MSFLDDVATTAKKVASNVGKSANVAKDTTKLMINAQTIKGDIKKNYEALGKLVYDAKLDGVDASAQVEEAIAAITALKEKASDIEEERLKIANKVVCESCGEVNPAEASFCAKCGAKIEHPAVEEADVEVCGCGCGAKAEADAEEAK